MRHFLPFIICNMMVLLAFTPSLSTIYYSRDGQANPMEWNNATNWTLDPSTNDAASNYPSRTDSVVIRNGHTIEINATNANRESGLSADDLGRSNVGGSENWPGSPQLNTETSFYHKGSVTIQGGSTLQATVTTMWDGNFTVLDNGAFSTSNDDIIVLGKFKVEPDGNLNIQDDFVISGNSDVILDNNAFSADDFYLDNNDAQLCGDGALHLGDQIQTFNNDDGWEDQVCQQFSIKSNCNACSYPQTCGCNDAISESGSGNFALPVAFAYVKAVASGNNVAIKWKTLSEQNNDFFTVERKEENKPWQKFAKIPGASTTGEPQTYQINDPDRNEGVTYYRVKQTDYNGDYEYSSAVSYQQYSVSRNDDFSVYPQPASNSITIDISSYKCKKVSVSLLNQMGDKLKENFYFINPDTNDINFNIEDINPGVYLIKMDCNHSGYFQRILIE